MSADLASVGVARDFIRQYCHALGFDTDGCDTAVLLGSETVTNAILHGHIDARVLVTAVAGLLLVEVADDNSGHPERRSQDLGALDRHGLPIIDLLAGRWGIRDHPFGKTVWFEVRSPDRVPPVRGRGGA